MAMRMKELSAKSGLPRTAIHHYIREGLLPPAKKTAPNAAVYGDAHLERLRLVDRLRRGDLGPMGLDDIRRVVAFVDAGMSAAAAVRVAGATRASATGTGRASAVPAEAAWDSVEALAAAAGTSRRLARDIAAAGLLPGKPDDYGAPDLLVLRTASAVVSSGDVSADDLAPVADLIREIGNYTSTLEDLARLRPRSASQPAFDALGPRLLPLCEALLWAALRRGETSSAPSSSDAGRVTE